MASSGPISPWDSRRASIIIYEIATEVPCLQAWGFRPVFANLHIMTGVDFEVRDGRKIATRLYTPVMGGSIEIIKAFRTHTKYGLLESLHGWLPVVSLEPEAIGEMVDVPHDLYKQPEQRLGRSQRRLRARVGRTER